MPYQTDLAGRRAEDALTAELVGVLSRMGISARAFPIFHIHTATGAQLSKPDLEVAYGGSVHIGSAKFGAEKEFSAFRTAQEYEAKLPLSTELQDRRLGEVFALTYPASKSEKFTIHILARAALHDEIGLVLDSIEDVADAIAKATRGEFAEVLTKAEPVYEEARRLLNFAAEDLASALEGASLEELETVFGGHSFFQNVLAGQLPKEERPQTLRLGAAFLFVNQVLFYVLLSEAAHKAGVKDYPRLTFEIAESPESLQERFESVYRKDYEPIYAISITRFMLGERARESCAGIVRSILAMAPKLDAPDLSGQVFQTLIPLNLRKPLGAHYTNPNAARLLARLAVHDPFVTILDPACGSGTLLVAAYRRILQLADDQNPRTLHGILLEERITGIDAMAFSAHLAAVGLALQQPLHETNYVRIGRTDSTRLAPGSLVESTQEVLPAEFLQSTLDHDFGTKLDRQPRRKGPVQLGRKEPHPFKMEQVDLVIMNPPFTSWENMAESYRNDLRRRYEDSFGKMIYLRPSQQLFFLFLGERFVKPGKRLAAVLPLTTFTVHAFHPWIDHFVSNWTVRYIVVGLGRAAFSEDTSLTECLVVADKQKPATNSKFAIIGLKKSPPGFSPEDIEAVANGAEEMRASEDHNAVVRILDQELLRPAALTLAGASLSLLDEYDRALRTWLDIQRKASLPFVQFDLLATSGIIAITGGIRTGEHVGFYGKKALIACRSEMRMRGNADRLVYDGNISKKVKLRDILGGRTYSFPETSLGPALRRFTFTENIDVTDAADICITSPVAPLDKVMERMYGQTEARKYLHRIKERSLHYPRGRWTSRVAASSGPVCLMRRLNLGSPNTAVLCVWSKKPIFPACEGYAIQNVSPLAAKLLTMWYNSTMFIIQMLARSTLTEGAWLKLEDFAISLLPVPDLRAIGQKQKKIIFEAFDKATAEKWPSLLDQLQGGFKGRRILDDLFLELAGVESETKRDELGQMFRGGASIAIDTLRRTMAQGIQGEEEED